VQCGCTWLKSLVAVPSPRRPGFAPASVHVGFAVDKVALGQVFHRFLWFSLSTSFHHCSILIYHFPMRCAIALTKHHSIIPSVRGMAQAVSHRPLTAEARVRPCFGPCGICGRQSGTGTGFSPTSSVFRCQYIFPPLLHTNLSPPHEVCDSSDHAAHYYTLGTWHGSGG
jgi:hypothetical protein